MIDRFILMNMMKNRLKIKTVMPLLREQFWKYLFRGNNFVFLEIFKLLRLKIYFWGRNFETVFWGAISQKYLSCLLIGMGADLYDCWLGWSLIGMTYDWHRCCLRWVLIRMGADWDRCWSVWVFFLSIVIH